MLFRIKKRMVKPRMASFHFLNRCYGKYQRITARSFGRRPFAIKTESPLISFTFDDFPRSALLTGGAILQSFGLAGTYYASLGLMGSQAATGPIFLPEDLKVLLEHGHELESHPFTHSPPSVTHPPLLDHPFLHLLQ